jgi:broad specificity phosphatase PhoE
MSALTLVYLVRHGRTTLNAEGRFRGRLDPPLDEEGIRQAEEAGRRVLVDPPMHVYSSPLRRGRQTGEAIARLAGAPLSIDEDLIDLDYGAWAGLSPEEAERRDSEAFAVYRVDPDRAIPPDGEPLSAVGDRVLKAIQRIGETHPGQTVAAVSHEVPIRLVVARVAGLSGKDLWDVLLPTGTVVRVRVAEDRLELPPPRPVLVSRRWRDVQAFDSEASRP